MRRQLLSAAAGLLLAAASALTASAPADASVPAQTNVPVTFEGTVTTYGCSGSLVRFATSAPDDPALVLTNGHCMELGMAPGQVVVNRSSGKQFELLNASGSRVGTLQSTKAVYGTMTKTDVAIYEVNLTYAQTKYFYGVNPLVMSSVHPNAGASIKVVSGYWRTSYSCNIDGFVNQLREGNYVWLDSVRYTSGCNVTGGTSGSPVIDTSTGQVVAVNNTGNEKGESCTLNNPCEVDADGEVTVRKGTNYAQETYYIPVCFGPGSRLDLSRTGCGLPRP
ncbi:trypsin-like serine peptidase [Streptomyces sp. NPDC059071]|uniref:trypsin-like serine peptidase n=1 Tax=unclassified Streptomyces TaxID=2593676 RepID=UPI003649FDC9